MNNPKSYSLSEVFNFVDMGFIFEFYSSKSTSFIIKELSAATLKNIVHTNNIKNEPTYLNAVLVKEYEGEKPRYCFKIARQKFHSVLPLVKNVLEWISATSECLYDNRVKVNLSFDNKHLNTLDSISLMDTAKLMLKFDEEYIYSRFPLQRNSPYCTSIKTISHVNENYFTYSIVKNKNSILRIPSESYNGINFSDYTKGVLEFNYIGGKDYAEKQKEIIEILEFYVLKTFQSLNERFYTPEEVKELNDLAENYVMNQEFFLTPESFIKNYPEINISANLNTNVQNLKVFWNRIKKDLFEMVINNSFKKGDFNYDSDVNRSQIRNANLHGQTINNIDIINCNITGVVESCDIISSNIKDSRIYNSRMMNDNKIENSYMKNVTLNDSNIVSLSIIDNLNEIVNCDIRKSIVKFAGIGSQAKLDESSVLIELKEYQPLNKTGVEVEEMRDYKWIADMRKSKDDGFQNAYVKPKLIIYND